MTPRPSVVRGIFLMLAASLSFAAMAAGTKVVSQSLSAAEIVFIRSLLGSGIIAFFIFKKRISWIGLEPKILLARGVVGFTAMILYFWCLARLDLGTAVMLNYTAPISAVLAARFFLREKLSGTVKSTLFFAFLGVYFLTAPQLNSKPLPVLAGLLSGLLAGTVHVLIRSSHEDELPLTIIFYFTVISTLGSGFLLIPWGFAAPTQTEWFWLLFITVTSLVGQIALTTSLRTTAVTVVSPFGYITPVIGVLLGGWFWNESLTPGGVLGGALIIACGLVLYRYHSSAV